MQMIIGGEFRDARDGKCFNVINPATNKLVGTAPQATTEDLDEALNFAIVAGKGWAQQPLFERTQILRKFSSIVRNHSEALSQLMTRELGKPINQTRRDFVTLAAMTDSYVEVAGTLLTDVVPVQAQEGKARDICFTIYEPYGVVACISPFNAPNIQFYQKIIPALITGNAVVIKPSSDDPLITLQLCAFMVEAGIPPGVLQVITGSGAIIGCALAGDPRVHKIGFTGSTETGVQIYQQAAKNLTHVSLELGGNAPCIIMADADVDRAVNEVIATRAVALSGQVCATAKRFFIHRSVKEEFTQKLVNGLETLVIGDPIDDRTQVGPLISEQAARQVEKQVKHTINQGAKLLTGGKRRGAFYWPTVLDDVTMKMDITHDMEVFGPVFPLITFDSEEQAIDYSNATQFGLGAGVITEDYRKAIQMAMRIEAGHVILNGVSSYGSNLMPRGAYKKSGIGVEGLTVSLQEYLQLKSIVLKGIL